MKAQVLCRISDGILSSCSQLFLCFSVWTPSCSDCRKQSVVIQQWEGIFLLFESVV